MTDQEIIYKAIREVVNTDNPVEFAAHNSTCYTIAKYVCEELRKELNTFPAEQPISDYLQAREKISSYLYNLIFDQAHRGAPMLQHGDRRINEEVDLILKMAIRELDKKVLTEQPNDELEKEVDKQWNEEYRPYDSGYTIAELSLSDYKETARHFAQWQKEQTINKASQWLNENVVEYHPRKGELRPIVNINAFREAMEKEDK